MGIFNPRWFFLSWYWPALLLVSVAVHAAPVPVAARDLRAGEVLTAADVGMAEVDAAKVYVSTPRTAEEVVGKRLSYAVKAGKPFNTLTLKTAPMVARDALVEVIYAAPGMELRAMGKALQQGAMGQTIKVLNTTTKTTLVAVVVGPNVVSLTP